MNKLLQFMVGVGNASEGDEYDEIMKLTEPDNFLTKMDMGETFESVVGYNPTTYFESKFLSSKYDEIVAEMSIGLQDEAIAKKEHIVKETLFAKNEDEETYLMGLLLKTLQREFKEGYDAIASLYGSEFYEDEEDDEEDIDSDVPDIDFDSVE